MVDEWHVAIDGEQRGPLTAEQIRTLASRGQLKPSDRVWKEGMTAWIAASSVRGLFPQQSALPQRPTGPPPLHTFASVSPGISLANPAGGTAAMAFREAATRGMTKLFDFNGRASRSEFWWFYLLLTLMWIPLLLGAVIGGVPIQVMQFLGYVYYAGLCSAVGARRLHDTDRSGWWQLLVFTGVGGIILLVWLCLKGTPSPNRFGPPVA
jgi:uncharacterized membrane protein YhaH (DUF805 family)